MNTYVVGFAFTKDKDKVLLIEKLKPNWQKGCLNGIGGKIERGELPEDAMYREAKEEADIVVKWISKGFMQGTNNDGTEFQCWIYYAYDDEVLQYKQIEEEQLKLVSPLLIGDLKIIHNLSFLIPFGLCKDHAKFLALQY